MHLHPAVINYGKRQLAEVVIIKQLKIIQIDESRCNCMNTYYSHAIFQTSSLHTPTTFIAKMHLNYDKKKGNKLQNLKANVKVRCKRRKNTLWKNDHKRLNII